jgi:hypothetical protein
VSRLPARRRSTRAVVRPQRTPAPSPTNGAHALQIELAGTCDPRGPKGAYYWPEADDTVLRALWAQVGKPLADAFDVPLTAPTFKPYPASADANGVRFTDSQWLAWSGHCGHQHIPGNDHGDPGAFPWDRLVQIANGDDDLPLTDDDAAKVAKAVFNLNIGADGVNWGVALQRLYNRPAVTAQDIAAAIVAQFKTLPRRYRDRRRRHHRQGRPGHRHRTRYTPRPLNAPHHRLGELDPEGASRVPSP